MDGPEQMGQIKSFNRPVHITHKGKQIQKYEFSFGQIRGEKKSPTELKNLYCLISFKIWQSRHLYLAHKLPNKRKTKNKNKK